MPNEKARFAGTPLERIVRLGLCAMALWLVSLVLASWFAPVQCVGMLKVAAYHAAGGRAAGISAGLAAELPHWLVVLLAFFVDMTVVFLFYPLIVYSYERGVRRRLLGATIESTLESARKQHKKVSRYGIAGLLFFVWFPFYMTGPLIGALIGYFLGMRPWANLLTVGSGTLLAIISWTFLLGQLQKLLEEVAAGMVAYIPVIVVGLVLAGLAAARLRPWKKRPAPPADEGAADGDPEE